jgi:hypothetical protein
MMPVEILAGHMLANHDVSSGMLVRVNPEEFSKLLFRIKEPLVVVVEGGKHYHYLTCHKGLPFYTESAVTLQLPAGAEIVNAEGFSIPG